MSLDCVVKVLKDSDNKVVWMGFYLNNKKIIDKETLDIDFIMNTFNPMGEYKEVEVVETEIYDDFITKYFPEEEDFSYLMDSVSDVKVGDTINLIDGKYEVDSVWLGKREKGEYPTNHWEEIDGRLYRSEYKIRYDEHDVLYFTVYGREEEFVWEDLYYQQSYLEQYLKEHNK